jgi:hypothetical protein
VILPCLPWRWISILLFKNNGNYLDGLVTEMLDCGFHFVVSEEVGWVSVGVELFLEVWFE